MFVFYASLTEYSYTIEMFPEGLSYEEKISLLSDLVKKGMQDIAVQHNVKTSEIKSRLNFAVTPPAIRKNVITSWHVFMQEYFNNGKCDIRIAIAVCGNNLQRL